VAEENFAITKPYLVLVEGPDDSGFFAGALRGLKLQDQVQIIELKGRNNLRPRLKAVKQASRAGQKIQSIGIVLDAEDSVSATAQRIREALKNSGFLVPQQGMRLSKGTPNTIFAVLPDLHTSGMLEDLCLKAFYSSFSPAMKCVKEYFSCLDLSEILSSPGELSKANVRAFLAATEKAETRLGIAAQKDWWPWDNPVFDPIKDFLRQLTS
jgi:hypothetical protein